MVDTTHNPVTVAHIQSVLVANTHGWLTTYPHMSVSYNRLATLIYDIITVYAAALRAVNSELSHQIDTLETEISKTKTKDNEAAPTNLDENDYDTATLVHYAHGGTTGPFSLVVTIDGQPFREIIVSLPDPADVLRLAISLIGQFGRTHGINVDELLNSLTGAYSQ